VTPEFVSTPVIAVKAAILHRLGDVLGGDIGDSSRSATVRATFNMRSCARAERPIRRTAISSVRSPEASSAHSFRTSGAGMREL